MRAVFLICAVGVLASVQAQDAGTTTTTGANTKAAAGDTTTSTRTRSSGGEQTRFLGLVQNGLSTLNNFFSGGRPVQGNRPFNQAIGGGRPISFGGRPVIQGHGGRPGRPVIQGHGGRPSNSGFNQGSFNQGGFQQGGFPQGGFQQGGFQQGGFQQGGFQQGGFQQGGLNQGGFQQGGFNHGGKPIGFPNQGSFFNQKRGACPPLRPICPRHGGVGPPTNCVTDRTCGGIDKCCADVCLPNELVCKTPLF